MSQLANIGNDIWVGNCAGCNKHLEEFDAVIHVWHESQPGVCKFTKQSLNDKSSSNKHLVINYKEHSELDDSILGSVYSFCQIHKGKILIHCAAGLGRSPTLCLVAKFARNVDPFTSMGNIAEAMWKQYAIPHPPMFNGKILMQVFKWMDIQSFREKCSLFLEKITDEMDIVFGATIFPWRLRINQEDLNMLKEYAKPQYRYSWQERTKFFFEKDGYEYVRVWENLRIPFILDYRVVLDDVDEPVVELDDIVDPDIHEKKAKLWKEHCEIEI